MSDWVFFEEQKQDGVLFRLAKSRDDNKIYHFEPLATRFRGNNAGSLRRAIAERNNRLEIAAKSLESGVLKVIGPVFYQDCFWLGWENITGQRYFDALKRGKHSLTKITPQMIPLINAYLLYHRSGLIVGRPDWGRLYRGDKGIMMPDPSGLSNLSPVETDLPPGLMGCRPPETFSGAELCISNDIYYLGLILYLSYTGKIPYLLQNGWPNQGVVKGEIIPPLIYTPELSPLLSGMIMDLLRPDPADRPTIVEVDNFWHFLLEQRKPSLVSKSEIAYRKKQAVIFRNLCWKRIRQRIWLPVAVGAVLIIMLVLFIPLNRQEMTSPIQTVKIFYQKAAGSPQKEVGYETNSGITMDFSQMKQERIKMAMELLSQPLAEVEDLKVQPEVSQQVIIKTHIGEWEWQNGVWQKNRCREELTLHRKGKGWEIVGRKRLSSRE